MIKLKLEDLITGIAGRDVYVSEDSKLYVLDCNGAVLQLDKTQENVEVVSGIFEIEGKVYSQTFERDLITKETI